jgi:hypothetical protein
VAQEDRTLGYERQAEFFARLRSLMLVGFFSLPQGHRDIGYMGNQPQLDPYRPLPERMLIWVKR